MLFEHANVLVAMLNPNQSVARSLTGRRVLALCLSRVGYVPVAMSLTAGRTRRITQGLLIKSS